MHRNMHKDMFVNLYFCGYIFRRIAAEKNSLLKFLSEYFEEYVE